MHLRQRQILCLTRLERFVLLQNQLVDAYLGHKATYGIECAPALAVQQAVLLLALVAHCPRLQPEA
jgi:hypothetical protein